MGITGGVREDLSDSVGIRKASLLYHFASKIQMVDALQRQYLDEFGRQPDGILSIKTSGREKVSA